MPPEKKTSSGKTGRTPVMEPAMGAGETASPVPITVAIGASAGGLEALKSFFAAMPVDSGLCFVVIMHHSPDGPQLLPGILSRHTRMEVVFAAEGMPLAPDKVCVIPATCGLTLNSGRFALDERAHPCRLQHPIDLFFRALAAEAGKRAIAVILSGSGGDGAEGAKAVKEGGGSSWSRTRPRPSTAACRGAPSLPGWRTWCWSRR